MRIVIAGSSPLAYLLAARFSTALQADDTLTLLDHQQKQVQQIRQHGFFLEDAGASNRFMIAATADPTEIDGCDLFFLCNRADTFVQTLIQAAPLLSPSTLLINMQRGLGYLHVLAEQTREDHAAIAAAVVSNSDIFRQDRGYCCLDAGTFKIGLLNSTPTADCLLDKAITLLNQANLKTEKIEKKIEQHIWTNCIIDLAVNPLAAIYRRPNGQLLTSCSVRGNMKKAMTEAIAVAGVANIALDTDPIKLVFQFLRAEKERTAPMLRDIRNKQATEIDALNGTIVKMGKELSIPTPTNEDFVMRIKKLEAEYL